jgi:hypothetical protein
MEYPDQRPLSLILILFAVVSGVASLTAVLLVAQRPVVVVVQAPPAASSAPAASAQVIAPVGAAATANAAASATPPAERPANLVTAVRLAALPALADLDDPAWLNVATTSLDLLPQQAAQPMLDAVSVPRLRVQSAHDGKRLAWRLAWSTSKPSMQVETSQFTDGVALQLPLAAGAPFTMGAKGKPVAVLHWKALWQADLDQGFRDVHTLYPNARSDLYWFAQGQWPFPVRDAFADPRSRAWLIGVAAGNPMSKLDRAQPVEELVAEGFGSSTTVPQSPSSARGRWHDGQWIVVIDRPLQPDDSLAVCLTPGVKSQIAFALWDGQAGNVAGRKHYVGWVPFQVEP